MQSDLDWCGAGWHASLLAVFAVDCCFLFLVPSAKGVLMNIFVSFLATLVVSLSLLGCAADGNKTADRPGVEMSSLATLSATVEAVDHEQRLVTLRGPEGNQVVVEVSEAARNFDQVEVGDTVEVEYYESVALFAQKPDGETGAEVTTSMARAPLGEKPGAGVAETVTMKATVPGLQHHPPHSRGTLPGDACPHAHLHRSPGCPG